MRYAEVAAVRKVSKWRLYQHKRLFELNITRIALGFSRRLTRDGNGMRPYGWLRRWGIC